MAVYVDDTRCLYRGMIMCHMTADSGEELLAMADRIGLARRWIQYAGTYREHFDIALHDRARAVEQGAIEVSRRELVARLRLSDPEIACEAREHFTLVLMREMRLRRSADSAGIVALR